jgi:integrase/recombinase XerD
VLTLRGSLLFPRKDGKPNIHIDRIIKGIAKRAGVAVPMKPMHSFRVLYATSLCRAGVDIYTIQKLLGHADIETTMSYLRAVKRTDPMLRKQVNAGAA